jgi:hypothetical protein
MDLADEFDRLDSARRLLNACLRYCVGMKLEDEQKGE